MNTIELNTKPTNSTFGKVPIGFIFTFRAEPMGSFNHMYLKISSTQHYSFTNRCIGTSLPHHEVIIADEASIHYKII